MRSTAAAPVTRLVLRPGTHVVRRGAAELQVGLDPRHAVVLPDRPAVRATLAALSSPAAPRHDEYDATTVGLLSAERLLLDADRLLPLVGPDARVPPSDVAALARTDGDAAADLLEARAAADVEVACCGSPEADTVAATLTALLTAAEVRHRPTESAAGAPSRRRSAKGRPCAGVLVAVGEPPRDRLDDWMRDGTPHLVLRFTEGHAVLGPFVVPGTTACLRCIDAHHTDLDPGWPLVVVQYASAVARGREDAVPEPVDSLLATLAAAWAARDLVSHAEGRPPATGSTTVRLDPHLTALESQRWPRHPACGCAWG